MNKWLRILLIGVVALAVLAVLIQLIPYGHDHTNPPVVKEPNWDSPETRAIAKRACFDCHSNETVWPWYSNIAPVSWLIAHDVSDGREHLNFSEGGDQASANKIRRVLQSGDMPPANYLLLHPNARLTEQEKQILMDGLIKFTQK